MLESCDYREAIKSGSEWMNTVWVCWKAVITENTKRNKIITALLHRFFDDLLKSCDYREAIKSGSEWMKIITALLHRFF